MLGSSEYCQERRKKSPERGTRHVGHLEHKKGKKGRKWRAGTGKIMNNEDKNTAKKKILKNNIHNTSEFNAGHRPDWTKINGRT